MNETPRIDSALLEKVVEIVKRASRLMDEGHIQIESKGSAENIVTNADLAVQAFLTRELGELLPGSGFFCEEGDLREVSSSYIWIVDPIDGTANFARHIPDCCISVALSLQGEVVLGVVHSPWRGETYTALLGEGAFLNGRRISVSQRSFKEGMFAAAMSTYHKEFAPACSRIIMDVYLRSNDIRRWGSAALELCFLAKGDVDLYFEYRILPWDYSAGMLIIREAGGHVASFGGGLPSLTRPSLVVAANTRENLEELLSTVHTHISEYIEVSD